ncbi:MAG: ShlB/FhaC/HecB family hemolysin secretion/activation protein [Candidatus Omnitrophota bacterium]|jgi:hemolysin activation/secretion protein
MKHGQFLVSLIFALTLTYSSGYAAPNSSASQEMGGIERTRELEARSKKLTEEVQKKKEKPGIDQEKLPSPESPALPSEKMLIKSIVVTGATLVPEEEIRKIAAPFENQELPLTEMKKVTDLITEAYRKRGYVTSRAYIPPQKIENNRFEIKVIEGKMGNLEVKGNRYSRASLFKKKITLKKGDFFDYTKLAKSLRKINSQPDKSAKVVLVPGKAAGDTDVVLEVKDSFPVHAGFTYDNYGSKYILGDRYQFGMTHNSLLGLEDIFQFNYTMSEGGAYRLIGGSYVVPVTSTLKVGASALWSKLHLLDSYKPQDIRGNSELFSVFATQSILDEAKYSVNLNAGFDVKNIYNYQQGAKTSEDKMRVAKLGIDADFEDRLGRSILTNGIEVGVPEFMGGLKAKDPESTAVGAGGAFTKYVMNFYRLQPMPFKSTILCKNQLQSSNRPLTSTEQFQIGGIINTRGYPPAEKVGDFGFSSTTEWSFPVYALPKDLRIPYTKTNFYDAAKLVTFFDYGNVRYLNSLDGTRKKSYSLNDFGWGVRFNLPQHVSFKIDFAYPVGSTASDGDKQRIWMQISANL